MWEKSACNGYVGYFVASFDTNEKPFTNALTDLLSKVKAAYFVQKVIRRRKLQIISLPLKHRTKLEYKEYNRLGEALTLPRSLYYKEVLQKNADLSRYQYISLREIISHKA